MIKDAKKKGRPSKSESGPASMVLQMRVKPELYDEIKQEAERNGRSIADQAERRLIHREGDVGTMVRLAISTVESRLGARWLESETVKAECHVAARLVVDLAFGVADAMSDEKLDELIESGSREDLVRRLEAMYAAVEVHEMLAGKAIPD